VPSAIAAYEEMRTWAIAGGPRPEGVEALRYHGMLQGLAILTKTPALQAPVPRSFRPLVQQGAFVRQLANLVLYIHAEAAHVC
jgi:hypothetical protein